MIRYHYPKGADFDKIVKKDEVRKLQKWINDYPRRMFEGGTAGRAFRNECEKLGIAV